MREKLVKSGTWEIVVNPGAPVSCVQVELEEVHMSLDPGEAVDVDHVATAAIDIGLTAGTVIAAVGEIAPGMYGATVNLVSAAFVA